ncbi:MAG: hypothetical protein AB4038_00065, partial [Prochloraceae cyanobacterium]
LEEPPPQVVFILATTDPQRVLSTIISRCQRFDYRRIRLEEMIGHLEYIATREKIAIAKPAITLVAQIANGGLRDAESLLDQLSLFPETITVDRVWDLVGAVPEKDLLELLRAIRSKNIELILENCRNLLDRGKEPLIVLQNLASFYLNLLISKTSPQRNDLVAVTETCWQELKTEAVHWQIPSILQGQQQLKDAEVQLKNTTQPRLWLEVTLLGLVSHSYIPQEVVQETGSPKGLAGASLGDKETARRGDGETRKNIVSQSPESQTVNPIANSSVVAHTPQVPSSQLPDKKTVEPISNQQITHASTLSQPQPPQPVPSQPIASLSETETTAISPAAIPTTDPDQDLIWQKAIALVQPPTTQTLLSQKCHLIRIKDSMVIMGVVSPPLVRLIQAKIANIEAAFTKACQRKIKVTLEVVKHQSQPTVTNNITPAPSKPESNGSSQFSQLEREPIKVPENISSSELKSAPPKTEQPPPKPVVTPEIERSQIANQKPQIAEASSESPVTSDPQNPIVDTTTTNDVIPHTPAAGDFQKAVELLAKSFDGEVISLGNLAENLPSTEELEEVEGTEVVKNTASSDSLNTPTHRDQSLEKPATTIRNRPDLTMYEEEDEVPF